MDRRTFLGAAGMAVVAGCSNGGSSRSEATGTPTPTPTPTPTGTGSADFAFEGVDAPDEVELNDPFSFAIRVRNAGSGRGTFTSVLSTKVDDGEWRALGGKVSMTLDGGESGVWESPDLTLRYLSTVSFRLDAIDETWRTDVVPKRLPFGESYTTPSGLLLSILGGSFESTYPDEDGTPAPDGQVWAVMRVDVRNSRQEVQPTPEASTFTLDVDGDEREMDQSVTDDPYEDGSLAGRGGRRGDLVYAVPEGTAADDVSVTWGQSTDRGELRAIWGA
ncbi:hypothetical protein [Haloplanus salilacus]|uniref:hypothetical protein n=1 Tax=Haloplanus salilacus TaxID=2949994 RepID=UPI0030CA60FB